jgi:hypothetical protein
MYFEIYSFEELPSRSFHTHAVEKQYATENGKMILNLLKKMIKKSYTSQILFNPII